MEDVHEANNLHMINKEKKENSMDVYEYFNMGNEYCIIGDYKNSKKSYENAFKNINEEFDFTSLLYRNYIICLLELGEYRDAKRYLDHALGYFNDYPDLFFLMGELFLDIGLASEAKRYFLKCTYFKEVPIKYTTMEGVINYMAFENLGDIFETEGNFDSAIQYLTKALEMNYSIETLKRLVSLMKAKQMNTKEILNFVQNESSIKEEDIENLINKQNTSDKPTLYKEDKSFKESLLRNVEMNKNDKKIGIAFLIELCEEYSAYVKAALIKYNNPILINKLFDIASIKKKLSLL